MRSSANSHWNALEQAGRLWQPSGWQMAEYAFHSGFLFSLLARPNGDGRGVWDWTPPGSRQEKSSPGIEAGPRPVRSASGRGAVVGASHNPQITTRPARDLKKNKAVLSRTQGEGK